MNPRMKAAKAQRSTYLGKLCDKHNQAKRYTASGSCTECTKVYANARNDRIRNLLKGIK